MSIKKPLTLLLGATLLVSLMTACSPSVSEEPEEEAESSVPQPIEETFELPVCVSSEPTSIDPALFSTDGEAVYIQHFFEGLLKWTDDGKGGATLSDGQASIEAKTVNDDGTVTYTFKIREGAKWSDGTPITAGDFVYSWRRLANPETNAPYSDIISMVCGYDEVREGSPTGEIELIADNAADENTENEMDQYDPNLLQVSAPDLDTFVVNIKNDCPYFEEICAFPATYPVRKDIIEAVGEQWTYNTGTYIGNGPYVMSEWEHDSVIECVPNDNYYDSEKLGPDAISFKLTDDAAAEFSAFSRGELGFINKIPADEAEALLSSGILKTAPGAETQFLCFNNALAPFNDARVREAFSLSINRAYICGSIIKTGATPTSALVPFGISDADGADFRELSGEYFSVLEEDYAANCEKARQLLDEAGYHGGEGFPEVEYSFYDEDGQKLGEALAQMWSAELGVTVTFSKLDKAAFEESLYNGSYQLACSTRKASYSDPSAFLNAWQTGNAARYSSADFDAYINAAKAAADPRERMQSLQAAELLLLGKDYAIAPLCFISKPYLLADGVNGLYSSPLGLFSFAYCTENR